MDREPGPVAPTDDGVATLVRSMTLAEKAGQMTQAEFGSI